MYSTIKTAIKTHLEAITGIENVYGYEKGNLDGYPAAVVTLKEINCEYETTTEDERKYVFNVKIYQEMDEDGVGAEAAEDRVEDLIDTVLDKFEDDYTLSGNCHKVNIRGVAGYVDRGNSMRVLEFTLDCYVIYTLT